MIINLCNICDTQHCQAEFPNARVSCLRWVADHTAIDSCVREPRVIQDDVSTPGHTHEPHPANEGGALDYLSIIIHNHLHTQKLQKISVLKFLKASQDWGFILFTKVAWRHFAAVFGLKFGPPWKHKIQNKNCCVPFKTMKPLFKM